MATSITISGVSGQYQVSIYNGQVSDTRLYPQEDCYFRIVGQSGYFFYEHELVVSFKDGDNFMALGADNIDALKQELGISEDNPNDTTISTTSIDFVLGIEASLENGYTALELVSPSGEVYAYDLTEAPPEPWNFSASQLQIDSFGGPVQWEPGFWKLATRDSNGATVYSEPMQPVGALLVDDSNAGLFSDLATATSWIEGATNGTVSNSSFANGVFRCDLEPGTAAGDYFLDGYATISFRDPLGIISSYGSNCFGLNSAYVLLGADVYFSGTNAFAEAGGSVEIGANSTIAGSYFAKDFGGAMTMRGNITVNSGDAFYSINSGGTIIFLGNIIDGGSPSNMFYGCEGAIILDGNIGATEGLDFPDAFGSPVGTPSINARATKLTSNGGNPEGDLAHAAANGFTVNYIL